jgi:hypothetical protein
MASTAVSVDRNKEKEKEEGKREEGELIFFRPNGLSPKLEHLRPPRGRRQLSRVRAIHVSERPTPPTRPSTKAIYRGPICISSDVSRRRRCGGHLAHTVPFLLQLELQKGGAHIKRKRLEHSLGIYYLLPYPLRASTHADTPPHAHSPAERATHCFRMVAIRPDACHQSSS